MSKNRLRWLFAGVFLLALYAHASLAQEGAGDKPSLVLHGFLLGDVAVRTTGQRPPGGEGGDFVLSEARLRLEVSGSTTSGAGYVLLKTDGAYDALTGKPGLAVREAYAGYAKGPWDLRLGRQVITWGVGDLFFINDVFPKDWESFFSGRPIEYFKRGVDGMQARYSSNAVNVEFVAIPFFTPDTLPPASRFFLFDPYRTAPNQQEVEPPTTVSNTELGLRFYRQVAGFDVSFCAYRGFWHTPSVRTGCLAQPAGVRRFFPELSVYGASAQRNLGGGVISLETGYLDSRQDRPGQDPAAPNSQWRFLAAYQRELMTDFFAGFQIYGELMKNYGAYRASLPPGSPGQARFRDVASIRLTRFLDYQAWKLSLFAAYSPADRDYFIQPEVTRKVTDNFSIAAGANVFGGGRPWTFFGQFDKSDNVHVNLRVDF